LRSPRTILYFPGMRVLQRLPGPRGRRVVPSNSLAYSGPVEERRKILGRCIKRARRRAGYRSQRAFADQIGFNETSVARAETGDERVGDAVFQAIEIGLGWTEGCITTYLETGDETVLSSRSQPPVESEPEPESVDPDLEIVKEAYEAWIRKLPEDKRDERLDEFIGYVLAARNRAKSRSSDRRDDDRPKTNTIG